MSGKPSAAGTGHSKGAAALTPDSPYQSTSFARFASYIAHMAGRPRVFALACGTILLWAVLGPVFHYTDTWQLIINTGTTIVTFLMVFLIQNTQNRDGAAVQAKLDELIRVTKSAHNVLIRSEELPEEELEEIREECGGPGETDTENRTFKVP